VISIFGLGYYNNARLIACLPIDKVDKLRNEEKGFKAHFITNPETLMNAKIKQGDKLVLIVIPFIKTNDTKSTNYCPF